MGYFVWVRVSEALFWVGGKVFLVGADVWGTWGIILSR